MAISLIDLKLFKNELKEAGLTLDQYAQKFLKNVASQKHLNNKPNEDQQYFIKKIKLSKGTYQKIIVKKKWKCQLCQNFYAASFPSFASHIIRHHHISLYEYFLKAGYTEIKSKMKKCAWCGHEAFYTIDYDIKNKTFKKIYPRYFCQSEKCKDKICIQFFGKHYIDCKHQFEHIGGKTQFLCKAYNTTPQGLKKIGKSKAAKTQRNGHSTYAELIQEYGEIEGKKIFKEKHPTYFGKIISKGHQRLFDLVTTFSEFQKQKKFLTTSVDLYSDKLNTIIEFYGDYWHCNPQIYNEEYYHKRLKMYAKEKWEKDQKRIQKIHQNFPDKKIIIVWENSLNKLRENVILKIIKESIQNKEEITWI